MAKNKFLPVFLEILETILDSHSFFRSYGSGSLYQDYFTSPAFYRGLKNLKHRGFIVSKNDGYFFTKKGNDWFINSQQKYFRIHHGKWDKKWRIILFDIPVEMEKQRQIFRRRIKRIGCQMIQKSVFVFPYPCEGEIGDWCEELGLSDRIDIITTDSVGSKEPEFKKYFNL